MRTNAPPEVEILIRRSDKGYLLHAVNRFAAPPGLGDASNPPQIRDVKILLNRSRLGQYSSAELLAGKGHIEITQDERWLIITIPEIRIHSCLAIS